MPDPKETAKGFLNVIELDHEVLLAVVSAANEVGSGYAWISEFLETVYDDVAADGPMRFGLRESIEQALSMRPSPLANESEWSKLELSAGATLMTPAF
jgi:hypothetical protein